mgnify:CR=1 FL=1
MTLNLTLYNCWLYSCYHHDSLRLRLSLHQSLLHKHSVIRAHSQMKWSLPSLSELVWQAVGFNTTILVPVNMFDTMFTWSNFHVIFLPPTLKASHANITPFSCLLVLSVNTWPTYSFLKEAAYSAAVCDRISSSWGSLTPASHSVEHIGGSGWIVASHKSL